MDSDLLTLHRLFVVLEATAVLRHDLRNKLASMRNAGFYLQRKVEAGAPALVAADPKIATFFGLLRSEADEAAAMIAERLPRLGDPVPAAVELADVVADALVHVHPPAGVAIERPGPGARGRGARDELAVAVLCLVENAIEAAGTRGGTVRIGCELRGDRAVIAIVDDGPGLGALVARPGRLGVGLAIARRIAARAGGSIELRAADGGGVRAELAVPRS